MSDAVCIGTFDGVHLGHRRVIEEALATGLRVRALTFHPHPRLVLGNFVELISTLERRLELLAELGVAETTVLDFTLEVAQQEPEDFAATHLAGAASDRPVDETEKQLSIALGSRLAEIAARLAR